MSLWLQSALEALEEGDYRNLRGLVTQAPLRLPDCMLREIEYGETHFHENSEGRLFPIRFMWLMECNEQRMFGHAPLGRSTYHPEKLLDFWTKALEDEVFRNEMEQQGFRFDLDDKALEMTAGWIYIGESFIQDLIEIERAIGVEMLFPDQDSGEHRAVFSEQKGKA